MKSTIQDLKDRRSIRAYKPEQISDEKLDMILDAGSYAPSGMGAQSPIMVTVQNKAVIEKLSKMNAAVIGDPDALPFYGAPTVIIVFADKTVPTYIEDGSLVLGNLMNAAHALGLGSCWIHRAREEFESAEGRALMKEWGIADKYAGIGHCILGYIDASVPTAKPRKTDYFIKIR